MLHIWHTCTHLCRVKRWNNLLQCAHFIKTVINHLPVIEDVHIQDKFWEFKLRNDVFEADILLGIKVFHIQILIPNEYVFISLHHIRVQKPLSIPPDKRPITQWQNRCDGRQRLQNHWRGVGESSMQLDSPCSRSKKLRGQGLFNSVRKLYMATDSTCTNINLKKNRFNG